MLDAMPCSSLAAIWSFASLLIIGETFFGHFDLHCRFLLSNAFPMTNPLPRNFYSPFSCTHAHICTHLHTFAHLQAHRAWIGAEFLSGLHPRSSFQQEAPCRAAEFQLPSAGDFNHNHHQPSKKHLTGGLDHIVDSGERSTARGERGDDRLLSHQGDCGARNRDDCDAAYNFLLLI